MKTTSSEPPAIHVDDLEAALTFPVTPRMPLGRHRTRSMVPNGDTGSLPSNGPLSSPLASPPLMAHASVVAYKLRPFRRGDEIDLVRHANNPRVWETLSDMFPRPYTEEHARAWIDRNLDLLEKMRQYFVRVGGGHAQPRPEPFELAGGMEGLPIVTDFAIVAVKECPETLEPQEECIGSIGLEFRYFCPRAEDGKLRPCGVFFGYWLSEDYWNRGIVSASVRTFVHAYLFGHLAQSPMDMEIHRVESRVFTDHMSSQ